MEDATTVMQKTMDAEKVKKQQYEDAKILFTNEAETILRELCNEHSKTWTGKETIELPAMLTSRATQIGMTSRHDFMMALDTAATRLCREWKDETKEYNWYVSVTTQGFPGSFSGTVDLSICQNFFVKAKVDPAKKARKTAPGIRKRKTNTI